jgi:hypothetical protein
VHTRVAGDRDALAFGLQAAGDAARASPSSSAGGQAISGNFNLARPTARTRSPPTQEDLRDFCRIAAEHDSPESIVAEMVALHSHRDNPGLCGTPPGRPSPKARNRPRAAKCRCGLADLRIAAVATERRLF